jgi:hypothetical protein
MQLLVVWAGPGEDMGQLDYIVGLADYYRSLLMLISAGSD